MGGSLQGAVILSSNLNPSEVESAAVKNESSGKMQRCTASLLSVVMPPKVNLALRAENYPSWRGNIEEGHAETLGSLQKNPKVKDGERAILYSS